MEHLYDLIHVVIRLFEKGSRGKGGLVPDKRLLEWNVRSHRRMLSSDDGKRDALLAEVRVRMR